MEAMNDRKSRLRSSSRPDIEWQTLEGFPDGGTFRGPEGSCRFSNLARHFRLRLHLERCEALDDHRVLAMLRVSGEGVESGVEVSRPRSFSCWSTATAC